VYGFLSLIFIITPIFFAIGLIRLITIEAPVILGRFSRFLGRIFLKDKSYLLGLQMMKKKQYGTVIMFLCIFSALFVHLNVMSYSIYADKYIYQNYETGADLSVQFGWGDNLTDLEDFNSLTRDLKSITLHGESLVEDAMVIYRKSHTSIPKNYLHYVNFSKYLNFVVDGNKILPDDDFIPTVMDLIDYNLNDPERDTYPGAIVNEKYLENNDVEIGDITIIPYRYYDSNLPRSTAFVYGANIPVRIVGVMEFLPGVYAKPLNEDATLAAVENIAIDVSDLPIQGNSILYGTLMTMLVNLDYNVETDTQTILERIVGSTEDWYVGFGKGDYNFYINDWLTIQDYDGTRTINPLLVYKMAYLIFIVVLIQVALGLPILLTSVRRKEHHFYGILLSRGFGKKGIFRFMIAEIFIIYFIAIIGGIAVGLLSSTLTLLIGNFTNPYAIGHKFRIFINPTDLFLILGSVIGISLVIFLVGFLSTTRRSISDYLTKF
jgi:hypothetical protein